MNELLDYVSFQKRICENQLSSFNKLFLSESHPKYNLLKEEYEFYLLMENIVKSLSDENISVDQIKSATEILQNLIDQFKSSLAKGVLEEKISDIFNKIIGRSNSEKERSIGEFTKVYQTFKPLLTTVNILSSMFDKKESQGFLINKDKLKSLKIGGSQGKEITNLILNSISTEEGLENLNFSLQVFDGYQQNVGTNPILTNFIPNDMVTNPINVGIKYEFGGSNISTFLSPRVAKHQDVRPTTQDAEEPMLAPLKSDDKSDDEYAGSGSIFGGHAIQQQNTVNQPDVSKKKKNVLRGDFRTKAQAAGISQQTAQWMVKSGLAKWASENPDQLMKLAQQLTGTLAENKNIIIKFINDYNKQKQLVTEVVNKWNKLAGIK